MRNKHNSLISEEFINKMTKEEAKQFLQQQLTQDGFIVSVLSRPEQQFPSNLFTTNFREGLFMGGGKDLV